MIEATQLCKVFGSVLAVRDVTLTVQPGQILALLGPNGAGKTTTIRMLSSLLRPTSGWARLCGCDSVEEASKVRHFVGLLTELPGLYSRMNAEAYLDFFGQLQGMPSTERQRRSQELLQEFDLWEVRSRPIGTYSKGMRQKVALLRALLHNPPVILLDEPTSAMDPASAKMVRDHILRLRREGRAIIVCTHNLVEAETLADRIAIIHRGHIIAEGMPAELKDRFLGIPQQEIRYQGDGLPTLLSLNGLMQVEASGPGWIRYRTSHPEEANPTVLALLVESGVRVLSLGEVPRNLEEVYLKLVGER